ncbi:hypothetical protein Dimus_008536 [Dionaea muscipula]
MSGVHVTEFTRGGTWTVRCPTLPSQSRLRMDASSRANARHGKLVCACPMAVREASWAMAYARPPSRWESLDGLVADEGWLARRRTASVHDSRSLVGVEIPNGR